MGSLNFDLIATVSRFPNPGESLIGREFYTSSGGKGGNQAVAASRLGAETFMVGRVGDDNFGAEMLESLHLYGVNTSGVTVEPECQSGIAHITIDESGENKIVIVPGANARCNESEVEQANLRLRSADALLLQLELPLELSMKAAIEAKNLGKTVVFDPAPAQILPSDAYANIDYLIPNETEASVLAGFPVKDAVTAVNAAVLLRSKGVGTVIIKMGDQGVSYATDGDKGHLPGFRVKVVDTVAAGDAFNGAFSVAIAEGKPFRNAVTWAMAAGALAVTKRGAHPSMPSREDVERLILEQHR
tara:strand:+ start:313 stop:1218 length:906 start_codon:yes stop_codon:yes gene_type:complete